MHSFFEFLSGKMESGVTESGDFISFFISQLSAYEIDSVEKTPTDES
jgi:hypothetical protein